MERITINGEPYLVVWSLMDNAPIVHPAHRSPRLLKPHGRKYPDKLSRKVRHKYWLDAQQQKRIRRRQHDRRVPSARDLDAIAAEEKAREATKGSARWDNLKMQ